MVTSVCLDMLCGILCSALVVKRDLSIPVFQPVSTVTLGGNGRQEPLHAFQVFGLALNHYQATCLPCDAADCFQVHGIAS